MSKVLYSTLFLLFFQHTIHAAQVAGAEISYSCSQQLPGFVKVTLTVYTECSGNAQFCLDGCSTCDQTIQVSTSNGSGYTLASNVTMSIVNSGDVTNNLNPSVKNSCTNSGCSSAGSFAPGFEKYTFEGFVDISTSSGLPVSACLIKFSYTVNGRLSNISSGSAGQLMYTELIVNRCATDIISGNCNNGPSPIIDPLFILKSNEPASINLGMMDLENDSLSYEFTSALQNETTPTTYTTPYSPILPMPFAGANTDTFPQGISILSQTGLMRYTPTTNTDFIGVTSILVKQWKKISGTPTLLSVNRRDFTSLITTTASANKNPVIKIYHQQQLLNNTNLSIRAGQEMCLTIVTHDSDTIDKTKLALNLPGRMSNAILTQLSLPTDNYDSIQICWTPDYSLKDSTPTIFYIRSTDDVSPINGKFDAALSLNVVQFDYGFVATTNNCNEWNFSFTKDSVSANPSGLKIGIGKTPFDYNIANLDTILNTFEINQYRFSTVGSYLVKYDVLGPSNCINCNTTFYDTIGVSFLSTYVTSPNITLCKNGITVLTATAVNAVGTPVYRWFNLGNTTPISNAATCPASIADIDKKYVVRLTGANLCIAYDTVTISLKPQATLAIGNIQDFTQCINAKKQTIYNLSDQKSNTDFSFFWRLNNTTYTTDTLPVFLNSAGTYPTYFGYIYTEGCRDSVLNTLTILPNPTASFTLNNDSQCINANEIILTNHSSISPAESLLHKWSDGENYVSSSENPASFKYTKTGIFSLKLVTSTLKGCSDSTSQNISIFDKPIVNITVNDSEQCLTENNFIFIQNVSNANNSIFSINQQLISNDTAMIKFNSDGVYEAKLYAQNIDGCKDSIVKTATVISSPRASILSTSGQFCIPNQVVFTNNSSSKLPIASVEWQFPTTTDSVLKTDQEVKFMYTTVGIKWISLKVTNTQACSDSAYRAITMLAKPTTQTINGTSDGMANTIDTLSVIPTQGSTYNWEITNGNIILQNSGQIAVKWDNTNDTAIIKLVETNVFECSSDTMIKKVALSGKVGLNNIAPFANIVVFPNPAQSLINIQLSTLQPQFVYCTLSNMVGNYTMHTTPQWVTQKLTEQLNVEQLPKGFYLLTVKSDLGSSTFKILLQ